MSNLCWKKTIFKICFILKYLTGRYCSIQEALLHFPASRGTDFLSAVWVSDGDMLWLHHNIWCWRFSGFFLYQTLAKRWWQICWITLRKSVVTSLCLSLLRGSGQYKPRLLSPHTLSSVNINKLVHQKSHFEVNLLCGLVLRQHISSHFIKP